MSFIAEIVENNEECVICREMGVMRHGINCSHDICGTCYDHIVGTTNKCPFCRQDLEERDDDDEEDDVYVDEVSPIQNAIGQLERLQPNHPEIITRELMVELTNSFVEFVNERDLASERTADRQELLRQQLTTRLTEINTRINDALIGSDLYRLSGEFQTAIGELRRLQPNHPDIITVEMIIECEDAVWEMPYLTPEALELRSQQLTTRLAEINGMLPSEDETEDETNQPEQVYLAQEAEEYAQEEHIGQYPDHQYCDECGNCIGCGNCDCGEDPENYCPDCTYALGCCQCEPNYQIRIISDACETYYVDEESDDFDIRNFTTARLLFAGVCATIADKDGTWSQCGEELPDVDRVVLQKTYGGGENRTIQTIDSKSF